MKFKELSLMAAGAVAAVTVMAVASAVFYSPKAQAQSSATAPAPGGVSVAVTAGNMNVTAGASSQVQGGTIVLQDSVNRKITVTAYSYSLSGNSSTAPTLLLSTAASYTY